MLKLKCYQVILERESPVALGESCWHHCQWICLVPVVSLALFSTWKSIHVYESAKNDDFWQYGTGWSVLEEKGQTTKQCQCTHCHCTIYIKSKDLLWITLLDWGCAKHTQGKSQMILIAKGKLFHSGIIVKLHIWVFCATVSILCKNTQWQIHLNFNMYYIILNVYKEMNIAKPK